MVVTLIISLTSEVDRTAVSQDLLQH